MFDALLGHIEAQGATLAEISAGQIEAFLAARQVDAHRRHRYLLLFSRLVVHLQAQGVLGAVNPARDLLVQDPRPQDPEGTALTPAQVSALLRALPGLGRGAWRQARLQAVVTTLLYTGLRSAELLELRLGHLHPNQLHVPARRPRPERYVPLDPAVQVSLHTWLRVRSTRLIATDLVFPSNPQGDALSASTLFRQIRSCLQAAGVHSEIEGPTLLRNTCAARWLVTQPIAKVCTWMGYEKVQSALRFSEAAKAWSAQ
jgi:integrase